MSETDLQNIYGVALGVVLGAGQHARNARNEEIKPDEKDNYSDLVTKTDKQVEDMIVAKLSNRFPSHRFIGEESVSEGIKCELGEEPTWIIDPIDGTSNFIHGFNFFCISLALYVKKQAMIAVVYDIPNDKLYTAIKGKGAFCNGRQLHVSATTKLQKALVLTEFGNQRDAAFLKFKIDNMARLVPVVQCIRCLGSAAINIVMVAMGQADVYFEYGLHCWDSAAGYLIAKEAGATITSPTGGEFDLMSRKILVAATPELASETSSYLTLDFPIATD